MNEDILEKFKQLMMEDIAICLDNEIFRDRYKMNLISEDEYKEFYKANHERWNKLYEQII